MGETNPAGAALARAEVRIGEQGVQLRTLDEAIRFAKWAVESRLVPEGDTAASVFIKLQAGAELGFPPMRALAALAVVNGRLSLMGEAVLAKIRESKVARVHVYNEGEGDARAGVFEFERLDTGEKGRVVFTVADAKRAKLWQKKTSTGKDTPWVTHEDDMLVWKAVARGSRRYFSDIVLGLHVAEDARDIEPARVEVEAPTRPALPPSEPDPLLERFAPVDAVPVGELASHSDVEVPLNEPGPGDDTGELQLSSEPTPRRHRG